MPPLSGNRSHLRILAENAKSITVLNEDVVTQRIALVTVLVDDYDRAISYYTGTLGFQLVENTSLGREKRWVVVRPPGSGEIGMLLARAANHQQMLAIGMQTGGRVFLFLHTDDFHRDYTAYRRNGVVFTEQPRNEPYGTVAVFSDLYGNLWDLIQPKAGACSLR